MIVLGAMSGTSTDAIDVAALSCTPHLKFLGIHSLPFEPDLQARLLQLQAVPWAHTSTSTSTSTSTYANADPLTHMLQVRRDLTLAYAQAVQGLLQKIGLRSSEVSALGAHGQTLRHRPDLGFTYQLLDPALLAACTQMPVVADFRSADVAQGGQGAPLVPGFHAAWLQQVCVPSPGQRAVAVLNLGGFANLTVLPRPGAVAGASPAQCLGQVRGGDCGPANVLMDHWAREHFACAMDVDGRIAARGQVHPRLLQVLLQHPFFALPWPKSTGRDDFTLAWLQQCLQAVEPNAVEPSSATLPPEDVMATLLQLTAHTVAACIPAELGLLYVCGGGAHNPVLLAALEQALQARAQPVQLLPFDALGLPAQAVEACAFAWLAAQHVLRQPGNCVGVTGARQAVVLGALHCAP